MNRKEGRRKGERERNNVIIVMYSSCINEWLHLLGRGNKLLSLNTYMYSRRMFFSLFFFFHFSHTPTLPPFSLSGTQNRLVDAVEEEGGYEE